MWQTYSSIPIQHTVHIYVYTYVLTHSNTWADPLPTDVLSIAFHPGRTNQEDAQSWKEYMKTIGDPAD